MKDAKTAEEALRESEIRYRRIVNAITTYTYTVDMVKGKQVKTRHSEGCIAVTGYYPEDYEKEPYLWYSMVYDEDRGLVDNMLKSIREGQEVLPVEHRIVRRDGRVVWVRDAIVPYYDENGLLYRYDGMIEDITERKRLESALKTNENFLKTIIDTEPECIKVLNAEGALMQMNPAGLAMIEADSFDQVKGQCVCPLVSKEYRGDFMKLVNEVFQGRSGILEFEMVGLKGRRLWLETHSVPLRNDKGEVFALLGVTRDITERKRASRDREKELARIIFLLELYDKASSLSDKEIYDYALEKAVSFTESEIGYLHLVSEDQKTISLTCWSKALLNSCSTSFEGHNPIDRAGIWADAIRSKRLVMHNDYRRLSDKKGYPDGHVTLIRHMGLPVTEGGKVRFVVGVGNKATDYDDNDIIQVQLVTNELSKIMDVRRSAEALSMTKFSIDRVADAIFWIGPDARIWNVNETACKRLGYSREELLAMSVPALDPNFPADRWPAHWDELVKQQSMQFETVHRARDGRAIPVEVTANYMEYHGKYYQFAIARDITERKKAAEDLKKLNEDLEQRVIKRTNDLNIRTEELGQSQKALMNIVEDLNQKTEELEKANVKLKDLDQLKSMFIASMSHELRTPLNSVIGFSSIVLNEWIGPLNDEQKENIAIILRAGKHLLSLINDIIDVSKIETGKIEVFPEDFYLDDLISEAIGLVKKDMDLKGIELRAESIHIKMHSDRRRLFQCMVNYLSNAMKFTEKGCVSINVREVIWDEKEFIEIIVSDTGIGIREEDMQKLFLPFVRIQSPISLKVKGSGLGLYLVRKITTEILKGEATAKSVYGEGSIFCLKIPVML